MTDLYVNQSDHIALNDDVFFFFLKHFMFFPFAKMTLERQMLLKGEPFIRAVEGYRSEGKVNIYLNQNAIKKIRRLMDS